MDPGGTVVCADWSGARSGEQRHLWVARFEPSRGAVVSVEGVTRSRAASMILELAEADPRTVAGLDFAFSAPAWWMAEQGIASAGELWGDAGRLERWLLECRPPFWGRPGRRRPDLGERSQWRLTELAAPRRPRSVFQIGGAGAVGTASLRGMPTLARLRAAGVAVWPFDPWATPAVVEVWPRLALGAAVKSSPAGRVAWVQAHAGRLLPAVAEAACASPDALDAVAGALDLARRSGTPRPSPGAGPVVVEGWIDGVAGMPAARAGGPGSGGENGLEGE